MNIIAFDLDTYFAKLFAIKDKVRWLVVADIGWYRAIFLQNKTRLNCLDISNYRLMIWKFWRQW